VFLEIVSPLSLTPLLSTLVAPPQRRLYRFTLRRFRFRYVYNKDLCCGDCNSSFRVLRYFFSVAFVLLFTTRHEECVPQHSRYRQLTPLRLPIPKLVQVRENQTEVNLALPALFYPALKRFTVPPQPTIIYFLVRPFKVQSERFDLPFSSESLQKMSSTSLSGDIQLIHV
jgi:hypothetical protein